MDSQRSGVREGPRQPEGTARSCRYRRLWRRSLMIRDSLDAQGLGFACGYASNGACLWAATVDICDPSLKWVHGCGVEVC